MNNFPEDPFDFPPPPDAIQAPEPPASLDDEPASELPTQPTLFRDWEQVFPPSTARIPHIGHCAILASMALFGLLASSLAVLFALHIHLFGVTTRQQAMFEIHYTLGSEAILYLLTFAACLIFFPLIWNKGFFAGVQWNGKTALRIHTRLVLCALFCFFLAMVSGSLLPGPKEAPIDKIFRTPGAPWMLFAFGTTLAPFFEELCFRGFLLPALCTAFDWTGERIRHIAPPPLGENGHPQWSKNAMIVGAALTSLPFAALHAAQTGYSIGPFILLVCVSLILCAVRLITRSLAASVLVHAAYNFLLFSLMLLGSNGFHNLDKL